ncbi:MAG: hypothetical protein CMO74_11100 [Verrucomicrobiales bacterium]|nr:hypothetical protein [Verrucomicrobiales bacterium]
MFLIVVGAAAVAQGKDELIATGIGMIVASLFLIFVFIPFQKEISLMFVDLVDSTLDKNSRS